MPGPHHVQRLIDLARRRGLLHARELRSHGIPRAYLPRLCAQGRLVQLSRGIYSLPDAPVSEHRSLAMAAMAVPKGVICLLSALRYYDLGSQVPAEVWMALPRTMAIPRLDHPPIRFLRVSGDAFTKGRVTHRIDGVPVIMTTPAKTVADCFKFRSQIGMEVAVEALREVLSKRKATIDEIWIQAGHCRVARVIRPYLEAVA